MSNLSQMKAYSPPTTDFSPISDFLSANLAKSPAPRRAEITA
jgi:hypothetical protein